MREASVEEKFVDVIRDAGGRCIKMVPDNIKGFPDRMVILPGKPVMFVELKRPKGGRFHPLQLFWQEELRRLGVTVCTIKDFEEIDAFRRDYISA